VAIRRIAIIAAAFVCVAVLVTVERAPERPLAAQPAPDSDEYASSASSLANDKGFYGTTTAVHNWRQPPRYPPGYPMALAPFTAVGSYPHDVQRGAKFWAMMYVLVAVIAAWALGGPLAATLAALFIGISPFAKDAAGLVLSDAFTAMLAVLTLPLLRYMNRSGARLAGAAGGFSILARITGGVSLIALLVSMPRRFIRPALLLAVPSIVTLAILQWLLFGNPLETGYSYWGVASHNFGLSYLTGSSVREGPFIFPDLLNGKLLSWVCPCQTGGPQASMPNLTFYPTLLVGLFWVFSPPLVPLLGLAYAWRRRREAIGRYTLLVTFLSLIIFGLYYYQGTRFMAGPATILTVLASVWLAELAGQARRRWAHVKPPVTGSPGLSGLTCADCEPSPRRYDAQLHGNHIPHPGL
jgi:4-amino-4-deoxy-L-arabinose transferase-like glycosyltransferase